MIHTISVPSLNANDEEATLVSWRVRDGEQIRRGDVLCELETTKAAVEVEADNDGFVVRLAELDSKVKVGALIGLIKQSVDLDHSSFIKKDHGAAEDSGTKRWTKKAFLVARRLGLDIEALQPASGDVISEDDVLRAHEAAQIADRSAEMLEPLSAEPGQERVLLLGGAGGAGRLALEIIRNTPRQTAIGILDNNPASHGTIIEGVPVLGSLKRLDALHDAGSFDGAVLLFSDDVKEREQQFAALTARTIPFTNIVDPTAQLRTESRLGTGNVILANCFIGVGVTLGDNNFLANGTTIEHHSTIGSHNAFGPRTTTSGRVTVGNGVKFGMFVAVEPYLSIGDRCTVASGSVITASVPAGTAVKARSNLVTRTS